MTYLLIFLFAIACSLLIGFGMAKYAQRGNTLSRADRRELRERRVWMNSIINQAHHHNLLGDNFALIVIDEANAFQKKELE